MPPSTPSLFRDPPAASGLVTAHCDGGARGNPGPAGFGAQITDADGNVLAELSEFLGIRTNNYAEYSGLLASLGYALDHGHQSLRVISDSELMVKQIQGKYKVNSPDLKPLWQEARNRIAKLDRFEIVHALRHKNKDADRLANEAMDRGMKSGPDANGRGINRDAPARSGALGAVPHPHVAANTGVQSLPLRSPDPGAIPHPGRSTAAPLPTSPDPNPQTSATLARPAMLRGFARGGVIHLLGPHTLPDGTFVKIIPE